jgi:hypothetical protein
MEYTNCIPYKGIFEGQEICGFMAGKRTSKYLLVEVSITAGCV